MEPDKIITTYFGESLDAAINQVLPERKALIENFMYEKSALMLYADDGVGKSVLTLQACMQATSSDNRVFGEFVVPEPRNVLYFQMERHPDESFERMQHLIKVFPFDKNRFALSVDLQGVNLQDRQSKAEAIERVAKVVREIGFQPDIVAFDPIYTLSQDGLETAQACNAITSFFRIVQLYLNCSIIATSHTNRGVRDIENPRKRVGKDMYGNRFLSAFFTGSYHLESMPEGRGSVWTLDKNSQKNLESKFELMYEAESYQSLYLNDQKTTKTDRLMAYLKACKIQDIEFSFEDLKKNSLLSDSYLRGVLSGHQKNSFIKSSKLNKGKILYKFAG